MGQVSSGLLKMSGCLIPADITYAIFSEASNAGPPLIPRRTNIASVAESSQPDTNTLHPCLRFYDRSDITPFLGFVPDISLHEDIYQEGQKVYWLPMFWEGGGVEGLVLRNSILGEGLFERIGYFRYWERGRFQSIFQDWGKRVVSIV
jgi:hypothetical protein